jgi:hypothetical protein
VVEILITVESFHSVSANNSGHESNRKRKTWRFINAYYAAAREDGGLCEPAYIAVTDSLFVIAAAHGLLTACRPYGGSKFVSSGVTTGEANPTNSMRLLLPFDTQMFPDRSMARNEGKLSSVLALNELPYPKAPLVMRGSTKTSYNSHVQ